MDRDNRFIDTAADMEEIVSGDNQHYHNQEVEMSITDDDSQHSNQLNKISNAAEQTMEYDNSVYDGYDVAGDNKIEDAADTESDNDRDMEEEETEDSNLGKSSTDDRCIHNRADVDKTDDRQESRESEETGEREGIRDIHDNDRFTNVVHPQEEHGRRSARTPKPRVVYFAELPPVAHTSSSSHSHGHNNNNHNNNHRDSHASTRGNSSNNNSSSGNSNNSGNQDIDVQTAEDGDEDLETSDGQSGLGCALPALKKFFTMRLEQVILYLGGTHPTILSATFLIFDYTFLQPFSFAPAFFFLFSPSKLSHVVRC